MPLFTMHHAPCYLTISKTSRGARYARSHHSVTCGIEMLTRKGHGNGHEAVKFGSLHLHPGSTGYSVDRVFMPVLGDSFEVYHANAACVGTFKSRGWETSSCPSKHLHIKGVARPESCNWLPNGKAKWN